MRCAMFLRLTRYKISDAWREHGELGSRRVDGKAAQGSGD